MVCSGRHAAHKTDAFAVHPKAAEFGIACPVAAWFGRLLDGSMTAGIVSGLELSVKSRDKRTRWNALTTGVMAGKMPTGLLTYMKKTRAGLASCAQFPARLEAAP